MSRENSEKTRYFLFYELFRQIFAQFNHEKAKLMPMPLKLGIVTLYRMLVYPSVSFEKKSGKFE